MRALRLVSIAVALVGIALLCVNLYGEFSSNRHPKAVDFEPSVHDPVLLTAQEAFDKLAALSASWHALSFDDRMRQTTDIMSAAIVHYWVGEDELDTNLKIAFAENYLLYFDDLIGDNHRYREYENYREALRRGVGWCSQVARAAADFLREEHGLTAGIVLLNGHVIAYAEDPEVGRVVLLDPDFNIYFPFDLEYAENHPETVETIYREGGVSPDIAKTLAGLYADGGNVMRPSTRRYGGAAEKMRRTEYLTWIVPGLMIAAAAAAWALSRWHGRIAIRRRRMKRA